MLCAVKKWVINGNNASNYSKTNVTMSLTETFEIKDIASEEVGNQVSNPMNNVEELTKYDRKLCDKGRAILKVYMYELTTEFHFGLLGWKGGKNQIWLRKYYPILPWWSKFTA